jgi:hypothetical protein
LQANRRGAAALKSAKLSRETSYRPEAQDAATWCWRAGHDQARACTTLDLVDQWFTGAAVA